MSARLSSRLGFILLSAGCAIGIGNVWRFPYVAGQSGGGCFLVVYLLCLAALGVPVLTMEFAAGRAAQRSIARLHETLVPGRPIWRVHGVAGLLGCTCLLMFYTTVAGWMLIYFVKTAGGEFAGLSPDAIGARFDATLADPVRQIAAMAAVCAGVAVVCAVGIRNGLERASKVMMLALLVLIAVLAVKSALLDGAGKGLRFFLLPDVSRMTSVGVVRVVVNAMNQAFFTLSLGVGAMAIFGSYIGKERTLLGEAANVAALDTVVAVAAGLITLPACFAYGLEPAQGPGLVFVTLPNVFNHMAGGQLWGALFFLCMCFAALTTVLAVFENIVACLVDYTGWGRRVSCAVAGAALTLLSLPCILGFSVWSSFQPFGKGTSVLDFEDFILSDLLLPLGALAFALFCCHRFGWGWESFVKEANAGRGLKLPFVLRGYCAYVLPVGILILFVAGLVSRFSS